MGRLIGKTETGKLFHIVNKMDGDGHFGLCGCYLPKEKQLICDEVYELDEKGELCKKCMHSCFYKLSRYD